MTGTSYSVENGITEYYWSCNVCVSTYTACLSDTKEITSTEKGWETLLQMLWQGLIHHFVIMLNTVHYLCNVLLHKRLGVFFIPVLRRWS
jgi:hypothetical protein